MYLSYDWWGFKYGNFIAINYHIEYCLSPIHSILYLQKSNYVYLITSNTILTLFFMSFKMSFIFPISLFHCIDFWTISPIPSSNLFTLSSLVINLLFNCPNWFLISVFIFLFLWSFKNCLDSCDNVLLFTHISTSLLFEHLLILCFTYNSNMYKFCWPDMVLVNGSIDLTHSSLALSAHALWFFFLWVHISWNSMCEKICYIWGFAYSRCLQVQSLLMKLWLYTFWWYKDNENWKSKPMYLGIFSM